MRYMRTLSICAAALAASVIASAAADLPPRPGTNKVELAPATNFWSGFYIGGNVGWAKIDSDPSFVSNFDGFTYGGHIGIQKQAGWFVGGVEAGITNFANVKTGGFGCDCIVADLVAKVGVASNNVLFYGVGGGFWHNASLFGLPQFGWTAGAGVDWAPFNNHIIVGARYQYRNLDVPNTALTVFAHEAKIHLDYKF
jgi:outer membrane immunogenic protein